MKRSDPPTRPLGRHSLPAALPTPEMGYRDPATGCWRHIYTSDLPQGKRAAKQAARRRYKQRRLSREETP